MVLTKLFLEFERALANEESRRGSVGEVGTETAGLHALEPKSEGTFDLTVLDGIVGLEERSRAG